MVNTLSISDPNSNGNESDSMYGSFCISHLRFTTLDETYWCDNVVNIFTVFVLFVSHLYNDVIY